MRRRVGGCEQAERRLASRAAGDGREIVSVRQQLRVMRGAVRREAVTELELEGEAAAERDEGKQKKLGFSFTTLTFQLFSFHLSCRLAVKKKVSQLSLFNFSVFILAID